MQQPSSPLGTEKSRRRLVAAALNLTQGTPLAPNQYEQMLLDQFIRGTLTLDQVLTLLESVSHR